MMEFVIYIMFFSIVYTVSYLILLLVKKFAPDWMRNSKTWKELGLDDQINN